MRQTRDDVRAEEDVGEAGGLPVDGNGCRADEIEEKQRGQDAGGALDVERAPESVVPALAAQNARDEKPRQHEEKMDSNPAYVQKAAMLGDDHKDGDGAKTVELIQPPMFGDDRVF
jgi:hypothetical protein